MKNLTNMDKKVDWSEVKKLAHEYVIDLNKKDITSDELNDYESPIFEAVLEAIYGKQIFDKINKVMDKI